MANRMLSIGAAGAGVTALCCFTPVLVIALGAAGLSAALAWLDFVLLPMLTVFVAMTGYGLWLRSKRA